MGYWHAYYARQCGASICGVVDPNRSEGELKRRFRAAAIFPNVEALFAELKPDVLHVCTPVATHENIIEMALDARVHLLVEKPLAATARSTEHLMRKAAERGLLLTPVHQFVFQEGTLRTAASLARIGTPLHIDALFCSAGGSAMRKEELDQLVADILPHPLSLLESLFPGMLTDINWHYLRSANGEWRVTGVAKGISISFLVSLHGRPTEASLQVRGTNGSIHMNLFHGFAVVHPGDVSRARKITGPFAIASKTIWAAGRNLTRRFLASEPAYPGLRRLITLFYKAVREGSNAPLSANHAIVVASGRDMLRDAAAKACTNAAQAAAVPQKLFNY
jgi:predicted dehydrogenase